LGLAQTLTGQFAQAHESFDAASALAPDDLDIRTNLALAAALEGQETKAIDVARSVVASPGAQPRHRRNLMIVYGLLGLVDEGRATAPKGLSANEAKKLLARATAIRAISDAKARAKALGTIMS
jgi:Flp pilus assembly protein TadD